MEYDSHETIAVTLASAVASAGTFTVSYPSGFDESMFSETGHAISVVNGGDYTSPHDFTVSFDATVMTVTWNDSLTLAAGTELYLQVNVKGSHGEVDLREYQAGSVGVLTPIILNLGAPDAADADGVCTTELLGAAGAIPIDGAAASGGVATLDVPRNVTLTTATTDHSALTITVTGTDVYGNTIVEDITGPNNNTVAGKKAFKTVTSVASDGAIATNGISVGFGDVLGLPIYLADADFVISEQEDGAAASAGTLVAGINSKATATTGDVRGTYDPNSACDGAKNFSLIVLVGDVNKGTSQYAG